MAAGQTTAKFRFPFTCRNLFHYIFFVARISGSISGSRPPYLRLERLVLCVCVAFPFLALVFVVSVRTAKNEKKRKHNTLSSMHGIDGAGEWHDSQSWPWSSSIVDDTALIRAKVEIVKSASA